MLCLRPTGQGTHAFLREGIPAALNTGEPAVHIPEEYFRCIREGDLNFRCAPGTIGQRSCASERLLAVGGHDRHLGCAAQSRITKATPMLTDQARSAFGIATGTPRAGLDQYLDAACGGHAEKSEAQEPAKLAHARIALAASPCRSAHSEPDFIAGRRPIDPLKNEFKVEAELQFTDDDNRRLVAAERHEIAAADFTLHVKAEGLEEALHRGVK